MTKKFKTKDKTQSLEEFMVPTVKPGDEIRTASCTSALAALKAAGLCVRHNPDVPDLTKPMIEQQLLMIGNIIENMHRQGAPHDAEGNG